MKKISFDDGRETSYIIGSNKELSKALDICNYFTGLYAKFTDGTAVLSGIKGDGLYAICIEKDFNWDADEVCSYFVYEMDEVSHFFFDVDGIYECETPDEIYYSVINEFGDDIDNHEDISVDGFVDFLISTCGGRVVNKEEYINFDNLSEDERAVDVLYDLKQVDFFEKGSPEAHVLYEINKTDIQSDFDKHQFDKKSSFELLETFPDLKEYLNQKGDAIKLDIIENNYEIIQYINHPTTEMQKMAITQNIDALSLIKEPSIEAVAFANSLGEQSKLEKIMAAKSTEVNRLNRREIDELLENHKKWLKGEGGHCLDLRNANISLAGAYLKGADLAQANLSNVNLRNVNLQGADLRNVDLSGANLSHADLSNAILNNTNLQGANLYGTNLQGADLRIANLQDAVLSDANLKNANLDAANLNHAKLDCACLEHATLQTTYLGYADLFRASFEHSDLGKADLEYAKLQEANLKHACLENANLAHAILQDTNLSNADLSRASLDYANISSATLVRTELYHADLCSANLSKSNLKQANLVCADLSYADLSHANLSHADLHNTDFYHANMNLADMEYANLQDAKDPDEHQKSEETIATNYRDDDFER